MGIDMLEIFTAVMGLIQSILIMFNKKENWLFYMANIIALTVFSLYARLYGDVVENLVYVVFGLLGLFTWYSDKIAKKILKGANKIKFCSTNEKIYYSVMFIAISLVMYIWLVATDDPAPFLDAITTRMGFTATLMMTLKRVEAWYVWFIDDILMAYIYFTLPEQAFWLGALNVIWIFLAFGSIITWTKEASNCKGIGDIQHEI